MSRGLSGEDTNLDAAIEELPLWVLTSINLVGVMVLGLLRI